MNLLLKSKSIWEVLGVAYVLYSDLQAPLSCYNCPPASGNICCWGLTVLSITGNCSLQHLLQNYASSQRATCSHWLTNAGLEKPGHPISIGTTLKGHPNSRAPQVIGWSNCCTASQLLNLSICQVLLPSLLLCNMRCSQELSLINLHLVHWENLGGAGGEGGGRGDRDGEHM